MRAAFEKPRSLWSENAAQGGRNRRCWLLARQRIEPPSAAPSRPVNSGTGGWVLLLFLSTLIYGERRSVAVHTLVPLVPDRQRGLRGFDPCRWRLAMPGFPGVVLIPLGRLQIVPDTPLGSRRLVVSVARTPPAGGIHGSPKPRAEKAKESPRSQRRRPRSRGRDRFPVPVPASSPGAQRRQPRRGGNRRPLQLYAA